MRRFRGTGRARPPAACPLCATDLRLLHVLARVEGRKECAGANRLPLDGVGHREFRQLTSARAHWHALNRYTPRAVSWFTITRRARSPSFRYCTVRAGVLVRLGCYTVSSHSASARRRDVRVVEGARLESVCRGDPPTVGSNPTLSATARLRSLVAERVGFRHSAAPLAPLRARIPEGDRVSPGTNPCFPHSLVSVGESGIQALRCWRRFGHESPRVTGSRRGRIPASRIRWSVSERVGFRHSAAGAASGTNPHEGGLQALRGSRRSGLESPGFRGPPLPASAGQWRREWASGAPRRRWRRFGHESAERSGASRGRLIGFRAATYTEGSARGDGSRRGSEPVQSQPTNRVRAGRQQR